MRVGLMARPASALAVGLLTGAALCASAWAGNNGFFRNNAVGGVAIDAAGVVRQASDEARKVLLDEYRRGLTKVAPDLQAPVGLRMVSLKGLEAACQEAFKSNAGALPDEIRYLAGLQRVQYVFVYPDKSDIVLAGPGEGWRVDDKAQVVGVTTGRPVMQLDDLIVALRSAGAAFETGISCSIDPTPEGRRALETFLAKQKRFHPALVKEMAEVMGPQQISIKGVPNDSHFARVMVAADYRMKRFAMDLELAPVEGLPSFLDLLKTKRARLTSATPRWWLACDYEPLARSEDGLAWELRGRGVKALTDDTFFAESGEARTSGKKNPIAEEWANLMTKKYDELAAKDAVFGELRNLMDLCVVAALIEKEGLLEKAKCELPLLVKRDGELQARAWNSPKSVATQCSYIKSGDEYVITASGGVQIESWDVASRVEQQPAVGQIREQAAPKEAAAWWWNG